MDYRKPTGGGKRRLEIKIQGGKLKNEGEGKGGKRNRGKGKDIEVEIASTTGELGKVWQRGRPKGKRERSRGDAQDVKKMRGHRRGTGSWKEGEITDNYEKSRKG